MERRAEFSKLGSFVLEYHERKKRKREDTLKGREMNSKKLSHATDQLFSLTEGGAVVHRNRSGKVSPLWLGACETERTQTEDLMEQIADPLNLQRAYWRVKANAGKGGVDGMDKIFVRSEESAKRVMRSITGFIEGKLKLKVNQHKSRICQGYEPNFLGHSILPNGRLGLSPQSEARIKQKVKQITQRNRGQSLGAVIAQLRKYCQGWLQYFRYATMRGKMERIDRWIRRKLRCYRLKQCKRVIGVVRWLRTWKKPSTGVQP